jgi:hypothetical protein
VPASIASRSVSDIGGITLRKPASTVLLISVRRSGRTLRTSAMIENATTSAMVSQTGMRPAPCAAASSAAAASVKTRPDALT